MNILYNLSKDDWRSLRLTLTDYEGKRDRQLKGLSDSKKKGETWEFIRDSQRQREIWLLEIRQVTLKTKVNVS